MEGLREKADKALYDLYDYYGIRYGYFTSDDDDEFSPRSKDEGKAIFLLERGLPIPEDLAIRLLQYKAEDEKGEIK